MVYTAPLLLLHAGRQSLIGTDEGYYAQMAREMIRGGQWLAPSFLGEPWFEKPPLNPWLIAISFQTFGISEWSARLPSVIAGVAGVLLTYWIGRTLVGPRRALLGALVLPTMYLWLFYGRVAVTDVILTTLELAGLGCLLLAVRPGWRALAAGWGIAVGLGLLLKTTMILLPAVATLPWLIWRNREHRLLTNPYLYAGLAAGVGLFGSWYATATNVYGALVYEQLFGHLFKLGNKEFHPVGPFYYFWNLPANTFPWTFLALGGVWALQREKKAPLLLWSYPLVLLSLLQLFSTKEPYYLIQACPFIALLAGVWIDHCWQRRRGRSLAATSFLVGMVGLLLVVAAPVLAFNPTWIDGVQLYLPLGLALGILWLGVPVFFRVRRSLPSAQTLWTVSLIGGPYFALLLAVLTTFLGDFYPDFKAFSQQRLAGYIDPDAPIAMVYEKNGERVSEFIALTFYTPNPSVQLDAAGVRADDTQRHWWLSPESRQLLDKSGFIYKPLVEVFGWTLARRVNADNSSSSGVSLHAMAAKRGEPNRVSISNGHVVGVGRLQDVWAQPGIVQGEGALMNQSVRSPLV